MPDLVILQGEETAVFVKLRNRSKIGDDLDAAWALMARVADLYPRF